MPFNHAPLIRYSFGLSSEATIAMSTDGANPTYANTTILIPPSTGFTLIDATKGIVRNDTGVDLLNPTGTVSWHANNGTGGVADMVIWSETSVDDFVTFAENDVSLRVTSLPNTSEASQTKYSSLTTWKNGESVRFAMYNKSGGALSLEAPSELVNGVVPLTGFSFLWTMSAFSR